MQWLIALETENDPIPACRLMNVFRRKGVKIVTLGLTAQAAAFSMMALVETPEAEVDHIFNFLRRTEGVRHVACYRHDVSREAAFLLVDSVANGRGFGEILRASPEAKVVFACHGKHLVEVPAEGRLRLSAQGSGEAGILPFSLFKTTRDIPDPELVAAPAP